MHKLQICSLTAGVLTLLATLGCGGMSNSSPRILQSINVTPATADAQNFPNGQVQFGATGNFSAPPTPVTPLTVSIWTSSAPAVATVDPNSGVAQCVPGAAGNATIAAKAPSGGPDMPTPGTAALVVGTAQLNCP